MRIEKIGRTELPLDNDSPEREQRRFESARELDRKKLSNESYRKEAGLSREEYKEQNERARKLGFDALLQDELKSLKKPEN